MATRTEHLARPKSRPLRYPDRRSVYWLDAIPTEKNGLATKPELTPRWMELSRAKKSYTQNTCWPTWEVSKEALRAVPSERLCRLAQPRPPAAAWQPDRPLPAPVSRAVRTAVATQRLCQLAQPKRWPLLDRSILSPRRTAPLLQPSRASAHIELLATPKQEHPDFMAERPVCWPVSVAARCAVASRRLLELSSPKERGVPCEDYNPFVVSRAARSASASPRVQQLALPLPRKCTPK